MQFDFNFYSSLLLITFSQGLIYSFLLLKKLPFEKKKRQLLIHKLETKKQLFNPNFNSELFPITNLKCGSLPDFRL